LGEDCSLSEMGDPMGDLVEVENSTGQDLQLTADDLPAEAQACSWEVDLAGRDHTLCQKCTTSS
jgi:hypothetical protein